MKILLVHNRFQQYGGEDACADADCDLLRDHGHDVLLYSRDNQEISGYTFAQRAALPMNALYSLRTRTEIGTLVTKYKPDVAYVHNSFPLVSPSLYQTLHSRGVPIVQALGTFRFLCPNAFLYVNGQACTLCTRGNYLHSIVHRCYRQSRVQTAVAAASMSVNRKWGAMKYVDAFACVSQSLMHAYENAGITPAKLFLKPNFLDVSGIVPDYSPGEYALFVGRLSEEKGLLALLNAFETLPDIKLKIVGTGPQEAALRQLVLSGCLRNVEFCGFKNGTDKWDLFRRAAFVVVPSVGAEPFGMVVLEAYAAGKPVIAFQAGGLAELVLHGHTGLLVPKGDTVKLAAAIRDMAANPELISKLGRNGRRLVETNYSPAESYSYLSRILTQVTAVPCRAAA